MATKRDELIDPESCFNKAASEEPLFILRAQDRAAPRAIRAWVELARGEGCPEAKVDEAMDIALAMERWPNRKWPD